MEIFNLLNYKKQRTEIIGTLFFVVDSGFVLLAQDFDHAGDDAGLFLGQIGNIQEPLLLTAHQIVHRDAEDVCNAHHHIVGGQTDVRLVGGDHGRRNADPAGHLSLGQMLVLAKLSEP